MTAASIGFIGLGKMGAVMAPHLAAGGHHVTGYDISPPAGMPAGVELANAEGLGAHALSMTIRMNARG